VSECVITYDRGGSWARCAGRADPDQRLKLRSSRLVPSVKGLRRHFQPPTSRA
jgi:hypothetical protein